MIGDLPRGYQVCRMLLNLRLFQGRHADRLFVIGPARLMTQRETEQHDKKIWRGLKMIKISFSLDSNGVERLCFMMHRSGYGEGGSRCRPTPRLFCRWDDGKRTSKRSLSAFVARRVRSFSAMGSKRQPCAISPRARMSRSVPCFSTRRT